MFPEDFAFGFVQAKHALDAQDLAALEWIRRIGNARGKLAIGDVNAAICNRRAGITCPDSGPPENRRSAGGKFLKDPGLAPNRVVVRPEPLGPVVGEGLVNATNRGA